MDNQQIANILEEIGDLLEIDGANRFRVLAYQNAADNIRGLGRELEELWKEPSGELDKMPGIGPELQKKIEEMLETGLCQYHVELIKKYGRGLLDILAVRTIGPQKAGLFYHELGIDNLDKLKKAALSHKLQTLPRMGEKSEEEILRAIEEHAKFSHRMLLSEALPLAESIVKYLQKSPLVAEVQYAGSLRRRKETVGDLDILTTPKNSENAPQVIEHFLRFPLIKNVIANGPTKCSVILENGAQSDLRVVETKSFGAALHYFTGSKDHNIEIRSLAQKANKKINEYGIFDLREKDQNGNTLERFIIGDTEEHFYQAVGLPFIPPPLRETRGEFAAAIAGQLPRLVLLENLRGDLKVGSSYGDGRDSLEIMQESATNLGLEYLGIADQFHSDEVPTRFQTSQLSQQIEEIQKLNSLASTKTTHLLCGLTLSINTNGSLQLPADDLLARLDYLIIRINHNFNLVSPKQTARVLKALSFHPKIKILSCPTGRLLNEREAMAINMEQIIAHCARNDQWLEINAAPHRLDLPDTLIKLAIETGAKLTIDSDARASGELDFLKYGVWTAERGWAETNDIVNTQPLKKMMHLLK